jgi:hypothetical protein
VAESFSVGEIAIAWKADEPTSRFNGEEVEVVALPGTNEYESPITGRWVDADKYVVRHDGRFYQVSPRYLRKKRPPPKREQISTWDDVIVWRPKELTHV